MRWPLACAGLSGFFSVAFGALGSHLLKSRLAGDDYEHFATALNYQWMHSLALLAIGLFALTAPPGLHKPLGRLTALFLLGMVLFCGSLYLHALAGIANPAAPWGGVILMAAWLMLCGRCWKHVIPDDPSQPQ